MIINVSKDHVKNNVRLGDVIVTKDDTILLVCKDPVRGYFGLNLDTSKISSSYYDKIDSLVKALVCKLIVRSSNLELNIINKGEM